MYKVDIVRNAEGYDVETIDGREIKRIIEVNYGMMPDQTAADMSVLEIKHSRLYDKRTPARGGLHDSRILPTERGQKCSTCGRTMETCIGHPAVMKSPNKMPFYAPMQMKKILWILRSVCFYCSDPLIPPDSYFMQQLCARYRSPQKRLLLLSKKCISSVRCCGDVLRHEKEGGGGGGGARRGCGGRQPEYSLRLGIAIQATFTLPITEPAAPKFNPYKIRQILHDITPKTAELLFGMNTLNTRPENLMIVNVHVPSSAIRPPVIPNEGSRHRGEDDLTVKLSVIKKLHDRMMKCMTLQKINNLNEDLMCMHAIYRWEIPTTTTTSSSSSTKKPKRRAQKPRIVTCECTTPGSPWVSYPSPTCPCVLKAKDDKGDEEKEKHHQQQQQQSSKKETTKKEDNKKEDNNTTIITMGSNRKRKREHIEKTLVEYWHDIQSALFEFHLGSVPKMRRERDKVSKNEMMEPEKPGPRPRPERQRYARAAHGLRGLAIRQKSKRGRIRANVMGKRVNFCARTVIAGSMDVDIDEIGIPLLFKKILTVRETVNAHNIHWLTSLLRKGEINHIYVDGKRYSAARINIQSTCLREGWEVDRQLQNGDIVKFGRQPSLHKYSWMAVRVKILPPGVSVIQMNTALCPPFNADYDGDEMHIEVPQGLKARAEARLLMSTQFQMLNAQGGSTIIGIVQHSLLGAYLLSLPDVFLSREAVLQYAYAFGESDEPTLNQYIVKPLPRPAVTVYSSGGQKMKEWYTGKQLISLFFPRNFQFVKADTVIKNGWMLSGQLKKANYGNGAGTIVHQLIHEYGMVFAAKYVSGIQRVYNRVLEDLGCTIGPREYIPPSSVVRDQRRILECAHDYLTREYRDGSDIMNCDAKEERICSLLEKTRDLIGSRLSRALRYERPRVWRHGLNEIIFSGTKGDDIHRIQIAALLGTNKLLGTRFVTPTSHYTRLIHDPRAHGFVEHSFAQGLEPDEVAFHAAAGREGIVDTGTKTSVVGYAQRCFSKALFDLTVAHDRTVRDAYGRLLQLRFGDDGFDPSFLLKVPLRWLSIRSMREIQETYGAEVVPFVRQMWQNLCNRCMFVIEEGGIVLSPIAFHQIIEQAVGGGIEDAGGDGRMTLDEIRDATERLWTQEICRDRGPLALRKVLDSERCGSMFECLYRDWFNPLQLFRANLTKQKWQSISQNVCRKLRTAFYEAGECVGTICSQTTSQPAMQMTLNTFHLAGIASTSGYQSIKEIQKANQPASSRSMTVHFRPPYRGNERLVHFIARCLPARMLSDFLVFDTTRGEDDTGCCSCLRRMSAFWKKKNRIEYHVNQNRMNEFRVTFPELERCIRNHYKKKEGGGGGVTVLSCELSGTIQVYIDGKKEDAVDNSTDILVRGLRKISRAMVRSGRLYTYHESSGEVKEEKEYYIITAGSQLEQVWQWPCVDYSRTLSTDVREIKNLLGIEAARTFIAEVMDQRMKQNHCFVAMQWLLLLADYMTRPGRVVPITATGIAQESQSVIRNAAFEKVIQEIEYAGLFGKSDGMRGSAENLALTQSCPVGTGTIVLLNGKKDEEAAATSSKQQQLKEIEYVRRPVDFFRRFWPRSSALSSSIPCSIPCSTSFSVRDPPHIARLLLRS